MRPKKSITSSREGLARAAPLPAATKASSRDEGTLAVPHSNSFGARAVDAALPLRHAVGDDPGRFHRRVAQVHVAGDLALDPVSFAAQEIAQPLEFGDQLLDFRH